ncbi:MAG: SAM-dependent methyltransferase [Anaerolinea sp.]|nr:SAM-dependent methyltransferase [Anaerolinea sp.]
MNRFHNWYCRSSLWRRTLHGSILPWALNGARLGDNVLEVGPGPGLTTDVLMHRVPKLTAIEFEPLLAERLRGRTAGTNVTIMTGDATAMPFAPDQFSAVVSFTMLHHVPSRDAQDRLLREACRVLRPGGVFLGSDSRSSLVFRAAHLFDTMVLVDPDQFGRRLEEAGFEAVRVDSRPKAFRFSALKPPAGD